MLNKLFTKMSSVFYLSVFITYIGYIQCESTCAKVQSKCINIYQCAPLLSLLKKTERTSEDIKILKESQCGVQGNTPQVCCPSECFTPEGNPGYCMNIYRCPSMSNLLTPPVSNITMGIFQGLRCDTTDALSVCCSYYKNPEAVKPTKNCELTAIPPDPRTECCGLEANGVYRTYEGSRTGLDMYPWLVGIEYPDANSKVRLCGGALISAKYVITAAQCSSLSLYGKAKRVRLGDYDIANDGPDCIVEAGKLACAEEAVTIPIESMILHPNYTFRGKQNDIALFRLSQDAPYTDYIRPICLPTSDRTMDPPTEFSLFVAGWGAVNETARSSNVRRHVSLPFHTLESCQPVYALTKNQNFLWRGQLCAGGVEGQDTCSGDAGTPLVYQSGRTWELIGITSFGIRCGLEGIPGVYTNVFQYIPWIKSHIVP